MTTHFNIIVIGKGLVGSAAAKYLAKHNNNIAIIGPDEPTHDDNPLVYASHYDQARVQRIIGKDEVWTKLNVDSTKQYDSIQELTGINFHKPVGCLYVNPYGQDEYLKKVPRQGEQFNQSLKFYNTAEAIAKDFSDFHFPSASVGLFESTPSGLINPRLLIKAQLRMLEQENATIIKETVIHISSSDNKFIVTTHEGNHYSSSSVLVAAGSFVNHFDLLPQKLKLRSKSEVVLLVKVSDEDAARLSNLPSLLYEINNQEIEGVYMIQPVLYPDGAYYLKIGCNMPDDIHFENIGQIQEWFRNGDGDHYAPRLIQAVKSVLPDLKVNEWATKKCITSYTAHGRPYIGETNKKGLFVAGGCNGYSAMCSDAIGHVAAHLMINCNIPKGFSSDSFQLQYQDQPV